MEMKFKLSIVAAGIKYQALAAEANKHLAAGSSLSEHDITKIVTSRKIPNPEQAAALARVLYLSPDELFADHGLKNDAEGGTP